MRIFDIIGRAGRKIAGDVTGSSVKVRKRKIVIDGNVTFDLDEEVEIRITGGDGRLTIDAGGDVIVEGAVTGDVTAGMAVRCGNVTGDVEAGMGVECQDVGGNAKAEMGIKARDIAGKATAGMSMHARTVRS